MSSGGGGHEVEPEELVAPPQLLDLGGIDGGQDTHGADATPVAGRLAGTNHGGRCCKRR